mgnify:CR=1 FL=1
MLFQAGSLLLVIISVYLLKRIHIFSDKSYKVVQGLVFNLTLPCAIIMSFATNKHPMNLLWLVVFGLFACSSCISAHVATSHATVPIKCSTRRD